MTLNINGKVEGSVVIPQALNYSPGQYGFGVMFGMKIFNIHDEQI